MKWIVAGVVSIGLAILSLSIPAKIFTTGVFANNMNGIGNCAGGRCTTVTCPAGTCSRVGGKEAIDLRFCSKANCKK
jgi:hypothetical protein